MSSLPRAEGALDPTASRDEYGAPGASNAGRFQYTGQTWLAELGMYHYKARIYDPYRGRFLQTDPVGYQDDLNLYAYVGNDPIERKHPTASTFALLGLGAHCDIVDKGIAQAQTAIKKMSKQEAKGTQAAIKTQLPRGSL